MRNGTRGGENVLRMRWTTSMADIEVLSLDSANPVPSSTIDGRSPTRSPAQQTKHALVRGIWADPTIYSSTHNDVCRYCF